MGDPERGCNLGPRGAEETDTCFVPGIVSEPWYIRLPEPAEQFLDHALWLVGEAHPAICDYIQRPAKNCARDVAGYLSSIFQTTRNREDALRKFATLLTLASDGPLKVANRWFPSAYHAVFWLIDDLAHEALRPLCGRLTAEAIRKLGREPTLLEHVLALPTGDELKEELIVPELPGMARRMKKNALVVLDRDYLGVCVQRETANLARLIAELEPEDYKKVDISGVTEFRQRVGLREMAVNVDTNRVMIDGKEFTVLPHQARMLDALVKADGAYVTGPKLQELPACLGKNIYREFAQLKKQIPPLNSLLKSAGNRGYYLAR